MKEKDCKACNLNEVNFEHLLLSHNILCCEMAHHCINTAVLLVFDSFLLFSLLKISHYYSQVKCRHSSPAAVLRRVSAIHF